MSHVFVFAHTMKYWRRASRGDDNTFHDGFERYAETENISLINHDETI